MAEDEVKTSSHLISTHHSKVDILEMRILMVMRRMMMMRFDDGGFDGDEIHCCIKHDENEKKNGYVG